MLKKIAAIIALIAVGVAVIFAPAEWEAIKDACRDVYETFK